MVKPKGDATGDLVASMSSNNADLFVILTAKGLGYSGSQFEHLTCTDAPNCVLLGEFLFLVH